MPDGDMVFGSFECRRDDYTVVLDVHPGIWSPVEVRGNDEIIVGGPGRLLLPRVQDRVRFNIAGWVRGVGATKIARWSSFRTVMDEVKAAFVLDATGTVSAAGPYLGLESGEIASIQARPISVVWGTIGSDAAVQVDIEMECVSSPPDWTVTSS